MLLGKVVGTIVSTQKDEQLRPYKLLIVQAVDLQIQLKPTYLIAVDTVDAGDGDIVVCVQGSSARLTHLTRDMPVDSAVIAVVDSVDIEGKRIFQKFPEIMPTPKKK